MMRKFFMATVTMMFVLGCVGFSFAEEGNARKGKYTYKKVFKACHERGEAAAAKPPISPDEKTQAQWKRMFDKKKFKDFGCKQEWDALSEKELLDIFAYLHGHAADSPSPAKCK